MQCFSFLCRVKACNGCFRQVLFSFGGLKKWSLVMLDSVVLFYRKDCVGIGLGRLIIVCLGEQSYGSGCLSRFDCIFKVILTGQENSKSE